MAGYNEKPRRADYSCAEKAAYAAGVAYRAAERNKRVVCKNEACTASFRAGYKSNKVNTMPSRKRPR